jgi:mRNA-degrading endonuclease toxin of MazEF toxin-antitoxin module
MMAVLLLLLELSAMCAQPAHRPAVMIKPDMISDDGGIVLFLPI